MQSSDRHSSPWIVDITRERFETDVLTRSQLVPIIVDFWAPWCQPCRTLGPLLEQMADEYDGRFVLAKVNTEELSDIAAQFQVQSIPTVFALFEEQVIDQFQGLMPEAELRRWIEGPLRIAKLREAGLAEASDIDRAVELYGEILADEPVHPQATARMADIRLAAGRIEDAKQLIEKLSARGFLEPEAERVQAALRFAEQVVPPLEALRQTLEAEPTRLESRFELARALAADKQYQEALDHCLWLVERDKQGVGDQARQLMIDIFRVLPEDSQLTPDYRRKLASLLF